MWTAPYSNLVRLLDCRFFSNLVNFVSLLQWVFNNLVNLSCLYTEFGLVFVFLMYNRNLIIVMKNFCNRKESQVHG